MFGAVVLTVARRIDQSRPRKRKPEAAAAFRETSPPTDIHETSDIMSEKELKLDRTSIKLNP